MVGRTSSYKESYCQEVVGCLAEGHSIAGFAGRIGRCKDTVFEWIKKYPEFEQAVKLATSAAVYFWEQQLIKAASGEFKGNITAIIFGLKNRAHEEWRDVHKIEHGGTIKTEEVSARDRLHDLVARISERERADKDTPTTH